MIGQNILMELVEGDKVQVYVNTASGLFDHKNSHYTQFIGALLRCQELPFMKLFYLYYGHTKSVSASSFCNFAKI